MRRRLIPKMGETYEIVLSTYNNDGSPNAAPMGIRFVGEKRIQVNLFRGSSTLNNVLTRRCAVANLTSDPVLFYRLTFKRKGWLEDCTFLRAKLVNAPLLKDSDAHIEMNLIRGIPSRDTVLAEFRVKRVQWNYVAPLFYSRGAHALIEATIHATRIRQFLNEGRRREAAKLSRLINHYKDVIERVCPDSDYARTIRELQAKVKAWKRGQRIRQNSL